jgi:N6-L-threonylcarbamoyladenine synthase
MAIETSCDETAVAILRGNELLASEVASQVEHERYGGVVPEVASRNHLRHAPRLMAAAVEKAGIALSDVDALAATAGPGLASSLMIGASIAKGLALGLGKPYLAINHLEGHLLSPFFSGAFQVEPNISLVVSGGHTLLVEVQALGCYRIVGRTVDDAAGEAFDKVAKMLGVGYPGGPEIDRRARAGNAKRFDFPRSMLDSGDHNFSFSGIKTAVRYLLPKLVTASRATEGADVVGRRSSPPRPATIAANMPLPQLDEQLIADLSASFQRAVVETLVKKTLRAARECQATLVTVSGGVSRNRELRETLARDCERAGLRFLAAEPSLCTDNAAMIAFAAMLRWRTGFASEITEEIDPNLALA